MVINTSSNVSNFDFKATLDISAGTAKAIVEDISTYIGAGATNIQGIVLKLLSPSNIYFHNNPPNIDIYPGLTSFEINLPTFNGTVVWGTYKIYAQLIDADGTEYRWTENGKTYKEVTICKPNTLEFAKGNLGGIGLEPDFDCDTLTLTVGDTTPYSYKGQVPIETVTDIVVSWPTDDTGFIQTVVANFVPFTMPFSLTGTYDITGTVIQTYKFSETTFVIAGYYYSNTFDVQCQYSLCQALCDYQNLTNEVKQCATMSPALAQDKQRKLTIISGLIIQAKLLNNCGVDIGNILEEIKTVGGFECNCNCESKGVTGLALPLGSKVEKGVMCGDIDMSVTTVGNLFKINLSDVSYSMGVEESIQPYVSFETVVTECAKQFVLSIDFCAAVEAFGCGGGGGSGTVTSFSAGDLSPLFTTSVATPNTTPALSFSLSNAAANTWLGNNTGIVAAPAYNASGILSKTDDTNVTLTLGGSPLTALLNATSLTLGWTGVLSMARGGTNKALVASAGAIVYSDADSLELSSVGTTGQALISGGTGTPTWFAPTLGSVIFAGVGGILQQDNTNFFWDDTNNRLGLGINAALLARLHIKGTTADNTASSLYVTNSTPTTLLTLRNDGTFTLGLGATVSTLLSPHLTVSIGAGADVNDDHGMAIGVSAVGGYYGIALGNSAQARNSSIAIGTGAVCFESQGNSVAIGGLSSITGTGDSNVAIGYGATIAANQVYCVALGRGATVNNHYGIAIGRNAVVSGDYGIALGFGAAAATTHTMRIGGIAPSSSYIENISVVYTILDAIHNTYYRTSTPESAQVGTMGDIAYVNTGAAGVVYLKATGTATNTGWVALGTGSGSGTVTAVSVATANGFAGTSSGGATPALTISTTITGILKGNGTAISAATDADITGKLLTGYVSGAGIVAATDSILQAIQKLNGNIGALGGGIPTGTTGQTLYYAANGNVVTATSNLFNDGTNVAIGNTATNLFQVWDGVNKYLEIDVPNDKFFASVLSGLNFVLNGVSDVFTAGGNRDGVEANNNAKTTTIGDYQNNGSSTKIIVDDTAATINHNATNGHIFTGNVGIGVTPTVPLQVFGDTILDQGIFLVSYSLGTYTAGLLKTTTSGAVSIGAQSEGNDTHINLDDGVQQIIYKANGGHTFTGDVTMGGKLTVVGAIDPTHLYLDEQAGDPSNVANKGILYTKDVTGVTQLFYEASDATVVQLSANAAGANAALSNLSSVSINTSLLAQTGVDLGSTTNPFRDVYIYGAGTYATTYLKLTGTPTGTRTLTIPNATDTIAVLATSQAFTNKTYNGLTLTSTTGTFTLTAAKTFSVTNTLTLSGTDGSTLNVGTGGTLGSNAFNSTAFVTSVTGTSNRISSTGGATPVIDIDAAYVGQSSITTLGTVGTGTWNATAIADGKIASALTGKSYNGLTITATTGTFTLTNAKVLTVSNTLTLTATDGSTLAIGAGGTLGSNAYTSTAFAPIASPTFTGTVTIPTPFTIGAVSMTSTGTQLNYLSAATGTTGTTSANIVFSTSPTLTTPVLGVATATSINKVAITAPATSATLTIADGKTLTISNSLTIAGTDATTTTFPNVSSTVGVLTGINQSWTAVNTFTSRLRVTGQLNGTSTSALTYSLTNGGGTVTPIFYMADVAPTASGNKSVIIDGTNGLAFIGGNASAVAVARAGIQITNLVNTAGSESADLIFLNQTAGAAMTEKVRVTSIGDMKLVVAGGGVYVKEGTNATMGVATLVAGVVVVSTTKVTANSRIFLEVQSLGTVAVATPVAVTARSAGTSFTISSSSLTDTSVIAWVILEPS